MNCLLKYMRYTAMTAIALSSPLLMADPYTYSDNTNATIPDNGCPSNSVTRTFNVTDDFTVTDLNVGLDVTHTWRGDLIVTLTGPDGTDSDLLDGISDRNNNYNVLIDDGSTNPVDNNNNDTNESPYTYNRTVGPDTNGSLDVFTGKPSLGTWTLSICDDANQDEGPFNHAQLQFEGTPNAVATLEIDKTSSTPTVSAGASATYTITVDNTGTGTATSVIISDTLPSGFTFNAVTATSLGGGATGPNPATNSGTASAPSFGTYTIPASGALSITYTADVSTATEPGSGYTNSATADSSETSSVTDSIDVTVTCAAGFITNNASVSGASADAVLSNNEDSICTELRTRDYNDLPASYGDVSHGIVPDLYMGAAPPDTEAGTQGNNAAGDDVDTGTGNFNDDDGVEFYSPAGGARSEVWADVTVVNNTGDTAYVCAWMDRWTDPGGTGTGTIDGTFTAADGQSGGALCQDVPYVDGSPAIATFSWTGMPDAAGTTYIQFRVCSTLTECQAPNDAIAGRAAVSGEVEGYALGFDFTPTAVVINQVTLHSAPVVDFLDQIGTEQMRTPALYEMLDSWAPDIAAQIDSSDREALLLNLIRYLDPDGDGHVALLRWDTLEERGTIGFYVDRTDADGIKSRINNDMLPGLLYAPMGGEYWLADPQARPGGTYEYLLIEQEARGSMREYGPFRVQMPQ